MGIHYDYKSTRGAKAMEKQDKREKKLLKSGLNKKVDETIPIDQVVTLEHLTNPEKK